jgi:REP element-mobilizing transposase RayT
MSVRKLQRTDGAVFFCTFTCWAWLPLIERTQAYDRVYNWMHIARAKGFRFFGYVIMPNYIHAIVFSPAGQSINALLSNGKRFLAYDIVSRLRAQDQRELLDRSKASVRPSDIKRRQEHRVFNTSSDIRECFDEAMIHQKLEYIHANPVSGKWSLAENALDYPHSSMGYYERGDASPAPIEHYELVLLE